MGITFDEGPAHAPARDRFEALLERDPAFEVLESDRDFMLVRNASPDAETRLSALWEEASRWER